MGIAEFIEARAAERERAALAAGEDDAHRHWAGGGDHYDIGWVGDGGGGTVVGDEASYTTTAQAVHIALNDPARTLREVAAARAILAEHRVNHQELAPGDFGARWWCSACDGSRANAFSDTSEGCGTLRALAAIDNNHPDYDPAWAPEQVSAKPECICGSMAALNAGETHFARSDIICPACDT